MYNRRVGYLRSLIRYVAQYPVLRTDQSALYFIPWQTCSIEHHLDFWPLVELVICPAEKARHNQLSGSGPMWENSVRVAGQFFEMPGGDVTANIGSLPSPVPRKTKFSARTRANERNFP